MRLSDSGQARVGSEYTKAAYGLFPRYRLDEAIEIEVERLTGREFHSNSFQVAVPDADFWPASVRVCPPNITFA
jgi:hypothetical protein